MEKTDDLKELVQQVSTSLVLSFLVIDIKTRVEYELKHAQLITNLQDDDQGSPNHHIEMIMKRHTTMTERNVINVGRNKEDIDRCTVLTQRNSNNANRNMASIQRNTDQMKKAIEEKNQHDNETLEELKERVAYLEAKEQQSGFILVYGTRKFVPISLNQK